MNENTNAGLEAFKNGVEAINGLFWGGVLLLIALLLLSSMFK